MKYCGISDIGAQLNIDLLTTNRQIFIVDIRDNKLVARHFTDHIRKQLGCVLEELNADGTAKGLNTVMNIFNLREKINFLKI